MPTHPLPLFVQMCAYACFQNLLRLQWYAHPQYTHTHTHVCMHMHARKHTCTNTHTCSQPQTQLCQTEARIPRFQILNSQPLLIIKSHTLPNTMIYRQIDDRLYSTSIRSLEQTRCTRMWFYMSDQLCSTFYFIFYIHQSGVLTALAWLVPHETAAISAQVLCTPYNHAPCHFMQSHIRKVYACLAVTCHLHFWQNDRDLLCATVVTRGWNGYGNKSQHRKSTLEKKILPPLQQGFEPSTFQSRVRRSYH